MKSPRSKRKQPPKKRGPKRILKAAPYETIEPKKATRQILITIHADGGNFSAEIARMVEKVERFNNIK